MQLDVGSEPNLWFAPVTCIATYTFRDMNLILVGVLPQRDEKSDAYEPTVQVAKVG